MANYRRMLAVGVVILGCIFLVLGLLSFSFSQEQLAPAPQINSSDQRPTAPSSGGVELTTIVLIFIGVVQVFIGLIQLRAMSRSRA